MSTSGQPAALTPPRQSAGLRLSTMMFLQYAVWGVWLPLLARYLGAPEAEGGLGFTGAQIGWILGLAGSIGALTGPFIAGQVADRYMNAERALGLLLLLGGIVQYILSSQTSYAAWMMLSILYSVLYMPTLALTNSIAFANLDDPEKKFPPVRSLGTIGWIVASVAFPLFFMTKPETLGAIKSWPFIGGKSSDDAIAQIAVALKVSGIVSVVYAVFSVLVLPKTPPKREVEHPLAFAEAFSLFRRLDFTVLTLGALLISMIHNCYFIRTPSYIVDAVGFTDDKIGPVMAIGQVSEIVVLAVLGLFIKKLGYKWVLTLGAASFALRYGLFAFVLGADEPSKGIVQAAMLLHGLNYGFFFAGSFLFVEKVAPEHIRHSAQTVFGIIILGLGPVLAGFYNGQFDAYQEYREVELVMYEKPLEQGEQEPYRFAAGDRVTLSDGLPNELLRLTIDDPAYSGLLNAAWRGESPTASDEDKEVLAMWNWLFERIEKVDRPHQLYDRFWWTQSAIAAAVLLILLAGFWPGKLSKAQTTG